MKNLMCSLFLIIFIFISCGENEKNIPIYGYQLGQSKIQKLKLNIHKTDPFITFAYAQKNDSLKNINLKYDVQKDIIIAALDTFYKTDKIYPSKSLKYKMYQLKKDETRLKTFVFHENYGIIASLGFGIDQIFLKDSVTPIVKEFIFKDLFINVNSR